MNPYDFQWAGQYAAALISVLAVILGIVAASHALLTKKDSRSSLGWVAVCLGIPFLGPFFYLMLGFNRIQTRVQKWQRKGRWTRLESEEKTRQLEEFELLSNNPSEKIVIERLRHLSDAVTRRPLVADCQVDILNNGEEAYAAMTLAMNEAKTFVYMSSYIFDPGVVADAFIRAMGEAKERGVDVRLLVDGIGTFYTWIWNRRRLKKVGVRAVRFLSLFSSRGGLNPNLRNHRKILVIDGKVGFTGGMNVSDDHLVAKNKNAIHDHHFKMQGPVVNQMTDAFLEDWYFATGMIEPDKREYIDNNKSGSMYCRGVTAGPNEDIAKLHWIYTGALSAAMKRVTIVTPYFVPDMALIAFIETAVLRGVNVEIIVPTHTDNFIVDSASRAYFEDLLAQGVRIFEIDRFVHSKFLLIDGLYSLVGSANVDTRSFRLNFEFVVEIFDHRFNQLLSERVGEMKSGAIQLTHEKFKNRLLHLRLKDAFFKIFSPYL